MADGFNASRPFALAIGDPANLNGAIPVGSVHPSRDKGKSLDALYGAHSSTSMTAPHISGLLAAFLSVDTECIGYPDWVKRILLELGTDLQRDRCHQRAGLTNLSKIFLET